MVNEVYAEFVRPRIRRVRRRRGRAAAGRTRGDRGGRAPLLAPARGRDSLRGLLDLPAAQAARADEQPAHPAV